MKRVLAITALLVGSAAVVAPLTASADDSCAGIHVVANININGTETPVDQCIAAPALP